jgi:chromosome segregation ATPase
MPDIDSTTVSNIGTPPSYTAPTVTGDGSELTTVDDLDTDNTIDVHADQIEFDQWWSTAAHLIEDEEDVELANAQLQKIRAYVEAYSTEMQNKLNTFNKEDKEYQAKLQEAIQQAQINAAKATSQAQIDAQKVAQQAEVDSAKNVTQAQLDAAEAQQEASLLLQKENQEYVAKLQQFSQDVAKYSAEVQAKVQDHAAQINEIGAEIQIDSTEYNWMSQRYAALKGQYDQAFGLMAPKEGKD